MKRFLILMLCCLVAFPSMAQKKEQRVAGGKSVVFVSANDTKISVYINEELQNAQPQGMVEIKNLEAKQYDVRVTCVDPQGNTVNKELKFAPTAKRNHFLVTFFRGQLKVESTDGTAMSSPKFNSNRRHRDGHASGKPIHRPHRGPDSLGQRHLDSVLQNLPAVHDAKAKGHSRPTDMAE